MRKQKKAITIAAVGVLLLLFAACNNPILIGDPDAGALIVRVGSNKSFSIKAISGDVSDITVVLTNDTHPTLRDTAAYPTPGELVFANVKTGTWEVQVYLDNSSGDTLHYGEGSVDVLPGETAAATVVVFETGSDITIDIEEGVHAPTFSTVVDEVNQMIEVTILPHADVTAAGGFIKYTFGVDPADPAFGDTTYTTPETIGFGEVLKAVAMLPPSGDDASEVAIYGYKLPYFTPNSVESDGYIEVTLNCEVPGSTIRYTVNGGDPTYEYGILAGNGTPVLLTEDPSVLKAVAYSAGDPGSVSDVVTTTYDLNLFASILVKYDGTDEVSDGDTTFVVPQFPDTAPETASDPFYFTIENDGVGLDLEISNISLTGGNADVFSVEVDAGYDGVVSAGEMTAFSAYFNPTSTGLYDSAQIEILSNNNGDDTFTIPIAGEGNNPPTISFLEGIYVQGTNDGSHTNLNGLYVDNTDMADGQPVYAHMDGTYYLYYESSVYIDDPLWQWVYSDYFLGTSGTYQVDSSIDSTLLYGNYYKYLDNSDERGPTGESYTRVGVTNSDAWRTLRAAGSAPDVSEVIGGLGGWPAVGVDLRVFHDYDDSDAPADPEGFHIYKWYYSGDEITWTLRQDSTSDTYTVQAGDVGNHIKVEVTPIATDGVLEGTPLESSNHIYIP